MSTPNLAAPGVRFAWDPATVPLEWLATGQGAPLVPFENPSTPQKWAETTPASPEQNDDETPPKGPNQNPSRRDARSADPRLVATPQGFASGGTRTKVQSRKEMPTARSYDDKAKPSRRGPQRENGSTEVSIPELSLPASPSTAAGPPAPRGGYNSRDAFWILRGELREAREAMRELHEEARELHEMRAKIEGREIAAAPIVEAKSEPAKGCLKEFSVVASAYGRAAASHSLEELPASLRNALLFIRNVPMLPCTPPETLRPLLPQCLEKRPTLVLDLDETLVHCRRDGSSSSSRSTVSTTSPDLVVMFDDAPKRGAVGFRPHVKFFLEAVSQKFEVVVFTASQQSYADKVLNALDPHGTLIAHRLYRCHCTELRGAFFKELGLLGRPLTQCVLVDNSPISVACNADNSVLIRSWYGDQQDKELLELLKILKETSSQDDCRMYLGPRYGLRELFEAMRESAGTAQIPRARKGAN